MHGIGAEKDDGVLVGTKSSVGDDEGHGGAVGVIGGVSNLEFIPSTVSLVAWMGGEKPLGEQIINEEGIGILWATEPGSHTLRLGLKQGRRIIPLSSVVQVEIAESPVPNETSIRLDENAVSAALEALESSR